MTKYSPTSRNMPLPTRYTGWVVDVLNLACSLLTTTQALAEGHACEQSARRNAMDVSVASFHALLTNSTTDSPSTECLKERRRHDHQVPNSLQPYPSSCHYRRAGGDYHWRVCVRGSISDVQYFIVSRQYYTSNMFSHVNHVYWRPC